MENTRSGREDVVSVINFANTTISSPGPTRDIYDFTARIADAQHIYTTILGRNSNQLAREIIEAEYTSRLDDNCVSTPSHTLSAIAIWFLKDEQKDEIKN